MSIEVFRHESFILELPFHSGFPEGFILHTKDDPEAPPTEGWEAFDLDAYLGLAGGPHLPRNIPSTTLMFKVGRTNRTRLFAAAKDAWPRIFEWNRRGQALPGRVLSSRLVRAIRDVARPSRLRPHISVVQATRLAPRPTEIDEDWRWQQMHHALDHLNDLLSGAMAVRRDPEVTAVGLRDLPPLVLGFGWDIHADGRRSRVEWQGYAANDRLPSLGTAMTTEEAALAAWISTSRDHPLKQSGDFLLSGWASAQRGRYAHAVAEAGTAIELLISGAVRLAGPHYGYSPQKLANILDGDFASRTKDHFAVIFGYDRNPTNSTDPLGHWWQTTYQLRNQVMHRGHRPTEPEVVRALEATEALEDDFGQRLARDPKLQSIRIAIPNEVIDAAETHGHGPVRRSFERPNDEESSLEPR